MKPQCPNGYRMKQVSFHDDESLSYPYAIRWIAWPKEGQDPPIDIVWPADANILENMKMWEENMWKEL